MKMTKEEYVQRLNDAEEIKIYNYHKYIEAKVELGKDNLVTQTRRAEWLASVEDLKQLLDSAIKSELF